MTRRTNFLRNFFILLTITNAVSGLIFTTAKKCHWNSECDSDWCEVDRSRWDWWFRGGKCAGFVSKDQCAGKSHLRSAKEITNKYGGDFLKMCAWTLTWGCPGQPGSPDRAGNDGTAEYQCCCDHKYYMEPMCSAYMLTTGCDWTNTWGCPGQNSPNKAGDDGSVGYKCCCEAEHWKDAVINYVVQKLGANSCSKGTLVNTEAECRQAAIQNLKKSSAFAGKRNWSEYPEGCFLLDGYFYFNKHPLFNRPNAKASRVCQVRGV